MNFVLPQVTFFRMSSLADKFNFRNHLWDRFYGGRGTLDDYLKDFWASFKRSLTRWPVFYRWSYLDKEFGGPRKRRIQIWYWIAFLQAQGLDHWQRCTLFVWMFRNHKDVWLSNGWIVDTIYDSLDENKLIECKMADSTWATTPQNTNLYHLRRMMNKKRGYWLPTPAILPEGIPAPDLGIRPK